MDNNYNFNELFKSLDEYNSIKVKIKNSINENFSTRKNLVTIKIR